MCILLHAAIMFGQHPVWELCLIKCLVLGFFFNQISSFHWCVNLSLVFNLILLTIMPIVMLTSWCFYSFTTEQIWNLRLWFPQLFNIEHCYNIIQCLILFLFCSVVFIYETESLFDAVVVVFPISLMNYVGISMGIRLILVGLSKFLSTAVINSKIIGVILKERNENSLPSNPS